MQRHEQDACAAEDRIKELSREVEQLTEARGEENRRWQEQVAAGEKKIVELTEQVKYLQKARRADEENCRPNAVAPDSQARSQVGMAKKSMNNHQVSRTVKEIRLNAEQQLAWINWRMMSGL